MSLFWLAVAHASSTPVVDRVAAVVNDEVVTLSDVYDLGSDFVVERCPTDTDPRCTAEAEREVLDALVRRVLIRQELARLEVDVTTADVDRAIDHTVRQYQLADRAALRTEVEASGRRWDRYRDELLEQLRARAFRGRVLAPRVTVTDDELDDLYLRTARNVSKSEVAPFEEVKDQLREQVFAEKLEDAEQEWYQRARREAAVKVLSTTD